MKLIITNYLQLLGEFNKVLHLTDGCVHIFRLLLLGWTFIQPKKINLLSYF